MKNVFTYKTAGLLIVKIIKTSLKKKQDKKLRWQKRDQCFEKKVI